MKKVIIILLVTFLLLGVAGGIAIYMHSQKTPEEIVREQVAQGSELQGANDENASGLDASGEKNTDNGQMGNQADNQAENLSESKAPYVSPVDFDLLQTQNPDICAWLNIPDTNISYPVLKNDEEPDFYLRHDSMREDSIAGALFVDEYNKRDFSDNVTVIYGHHMSYGEFFGKLQSYYQDEKSFGENRRITLYLPEEERTYQVFAAVPYEKIHLLYNYDFTQMLQHYVFFDRVYQVRSLVAQLDEDNYPEFGEKVLILSTCLEGDNTQRYLVMGKEVKGEKYETH